MAMPHLPEPVKYFVALLWAEASARTDTLGHLRERFGPIDFEGPDHRFDCTDYYAKEMGPDLQRRLIALAGLRSPEELSDAKETCNAIEDALAREGRRRVNLDVGYLDHNKVVLASAKGAGQKIYLKQGIYADLVARFAQGRYQPFAWTFPDFKDGRYDAELAELRSRYLQQIKEQRAERPSKP